MVSIFLWLRLHTALKLECLQCNLIAIHMRSLYYVFVYIADAIYMYYSIKSIKLALKNMPKLNLNQVSSLVNVWIPDALPSKNVLHVAQSMLDTYTLLFLVAYSWHGNYYHVYR